MSPEGERGLKNFAASARAHGRSFHDALGPDYTLMRTDSTVRVTGIVEAAAQRGVPLAVLDIEAPIALIQAPDTTRVPTCYVWIRIPQVLTLGAA